MQRRDSSRRSKIRDPYALFRRLLHSTGADLRHGLSLARQEIEPRHFEAIVRRAAENSLYLTAFAPIPFPKSPDGIRNRIGLESVDAEREFAWTSSVLSLFGDRLAGFCARRLAYERALLAGDLDAAYVQLDEVESSVGVSIWLIANRIQLLQLRSGLKVQKDYLESVIASKQLSAYVGYLAFFVSYRAEENVSLAQLRQESAPILGLPEVGDHFRYHVLPLDLDQIASPLAPIAREEGHPIVDRWQVFVAMSQLLYARQGSKCVKHLRPALHRVRDVGDPRVGALLDLMDGRSPAGTPVVFDDYTEGHYTRLPQHVAPLELAARASLLEPTYKHGYAEHSLGNSAIDCMKDVLLASEQYTQAQRRLEKIAFTGDKSSWAMEIAAFLPRTPTHSTGELDTQTHRLAALNSTPLNPWSISAFAELASDPTLLSRALDRFPNSTALRLRKCLLDADHESHRELQSLPIPGHRLQLYSGHIAARRGDMTAAAQYFTDATASANVFVAISARRHLYAVLFATLRLQQALDLVVDHCLDQPGAHRQYPIEGLATAIRADAVQVDELALSILMHLASRHVHPRWERELSDAYDNALFNLGMRTPTALLSSDVRSTIPAPRLTYFLRHVCVPRILDDSMEFESVAEVEAERITVCQFLTEFDPSNSSVYASEIRTITRDAEVAHLLHQVEASKIYVDEEGLKGYFENTLRPLFERHHVLLKSPVLEYQAEQLAKRLKEMVSDKKAPPDFKHLRLPSSEREGLFESMLFEVISQFSQNPAFGLKIHLSTSIRHGVFEGHVRAPFAAEELLCSKTKYGDSYAAADVWTTIDGLSGQETDALHRHLVRFTQRIEGNIAHWLDHLLRIREPSGPSDALFNFSFTDAEFRELSDGVTPSTTYEEFLDRMLAFCWRKVDESMDRIRSELSDSLLTALNSAVDALIASIETSVGHEKGQRLVDSAVRAKTVAQAAVETIREWFKRPSDLQRQPFDLDLAVRVAVQQIENCYVHQSFLPLTEVHVPFKLAGDYLDGIVEVLFLLLQNVIRNSGFTTNPQGVSIRIGHIALRAEDDAETAGTLEIVVSNDLADDIEIAKRRVLIHDAQKRYEHDSAMQLAGREGGSGLSKVWRILQFDLGVVHKLHLEIDDARRFCARLELSGMRTC